MSTTIDQRIVEMRFDNKQFEQNVSDTLSSIDKLKQGLNFDGASKGLNGIEDAARKVNLNPLSDSIQNVGLKFNWLYTYADQTMRNITNTVNAAATKIVKAFTIDPVKTGFSEYETQINAVQTILANTKSKGTTLDDVNGALDELNAYADKTIYNFTEMTRNIGTFTAAGVDLDTSVSAIKGIANLAAVSGSTSQQASTAMYQLSQALSSGTVKLMDWNSVVNAGMGGQVFQDALKETARVHGIAIDDLIKQEGSFRETLSHGWLSSEILTETLSKFTGDLNEEQLKTMGYTEEQIKGILEMGQTANDAATKVKTFTQLMDTLKEAAQSGWTSTWEIVVGDFEEAKELFTKVSDTIGGMLGKSAESRNELLQSWKVLGGRTALIDSIKYSFEGVVAVFKAISDAAKEVFPPMTAERLVAISEKLRDLAKSFDAFFNVRDDEGKIVGMTKNFENLKRTFKGIFAVVRIVTTIFGALFKAIGTVLGVTGTLGGGLLSLTATIGDWLVMLSDAITYSGIFENVFVGIANVIKWVIGIFAQFTRSLSDSFVFTTVSEGLNSFLGLIVSSGDATERLAQMGKNVKDAWINSGLYSFLVKVWEIVRTIGSAVGGVFSGLFGGIAGAFSSGDFTTVLDMINVLLSGGLIVALAKLAGSLKEMFEAPKGLMKMFESITSTIDGVIGSVGDTFKAFQDKLQADALKSIATAILMLAGSLVILSMINEDDLSRALAAVTVLMGLMTAMLAVTKKGEMTSSISKSGFSFSKDTSPFLSLGLGLLAIAGAIVMLADLDPDELTRGALAAGAIIVVIGGIQLALSRYGGSGGVKGATWLLAMGATLILLASAMRIIAVMEWDEWAKGLIGVVVLLGALGGIQVLYGKLGGGAGKMLAGAVAIGIIATSLNGLIPILTLFAILPLPNLIKAVSMIVVLLAALGAVQILYGKLGNGWDSMMSGAAAIAVMADSLNKLIPILLIFAILPLEASLKAVGMLTLILAALGGVQILYGQLGKGAKNMLAGASAIAIIVTSLNLLMPALLVFAFMDPRQLLQSVLGLTAVLLALSATMAIFNKFGGSAIKMQASAKALLTMTSAILLLAPAILMLGSMNVTSAAVAIGTLVLALGSIVAVAVLMKTLGVIPTMVAFSAAVQGVGIGILAAGAGLLLFGLALSTIALGIIEIIGALTALVGAIGTVAVGLTVLVAAVIEGIIRGIGAGIVALCEVIIEAAPLLADACIALVFMLCDVIIECVPKIVDTVLILCMEILSSLEQFIPPIVSAIVRLITGIINALASEIPDLVQAVVDLLFAFIEGVINALGGMDSSGLMDALQNMTALTIIMTELAAMKLIAPFAMSGVLLMGVVVAELALVLTALSFLSGLSDRIDKGGELLGSIGRAFGQFVGGLVGGFAKGASNDLPDIAKNLSDFATNIEDFIDIAPRLSSAMAGLAGTSFVTGLADLFTIGGTAMESFKEDLTVLGEGLAGFYNEIKDIEDITVINKAADAAESLTDVVNALPDSSIFGGKDLKTFSDDLGNLADGLVEFSDTIGERDFKNVSNAIVAARGIAEMSTLIPDNTGLATWITGDTAISLFGDDLVRLGEGIAAFAEKVNGVPDVSAAINVGKGLVDLINNIPNEGGVISWFAGENSISKFSKDLGDLGTGINNFATNAGNITSDSITPAIEAATQLAKMTQLVPSEGGIKSWFAGETAMSKFADDLGNLGTGIHNFATNAGDITSDSITPAVDAAKQFADMTQLVPSEGGIKSWFAGESALAKFGDDLGNLGTGINKFATNAGDITSDSITPAVDAAKKLAELTQLVPNEGGIKSWFAGESALSKFGDDLGDLGTGINKFATNAGNITSDSVTPAVDAAKKLAEMTQFVPSEGGIKSWFLGETAMSKFADQLPGLATGLAGFAINLGDTSFENVEAAANAGKILAEMTQFIPDEGGIKSWFTGDTAFTKFASQLPELAKGLVGFATNLGNTSFENVEAAANAGKTLAEMTSTLPKDSDKIVDFGKNLDRFGDGMKTFISDVSDINENAISGANLVVKLAKDASTIDSGSIKKVSSALEDLADVVEDMEKDIKSDMKDAGKKAVEGYIKGIDDKIDDAKDKAKELVTDAAEAASKEKSEFETAGENAADGYAQGIKNHQNNAVNAALAMVAAVLNAIKEAQDSHSPSRETNKLGEYGGMGFVNGLYEYVSKASDVGYDLGNAANGGLKDAISKVQDFIDGGMDTQPTIRPVLDLSDIESRAGLIGGLLGSSSVGVKANLGAINSMMNSRNQNGTNADVIDAIKELREELSNVGNTYYNVEGITYDDGSNIAEAVSTLIHAAKIERRV